MQTNLPVYNARQHTPGKPTATDKQVTLLRSLGWRFPIRSMAHAGKLISLYEAGEKPHLQRSQTALDL